MSALGEFRRQLESDLTWKKFRKQIQNLWKPEFDTQLDELRTLHGSRRTRTLNTGFPTGRKVIEATAQDMAVRSRCVEIAMDGTIVKNGMQVALSTIQKYLEAKYYDFMKELGFSGVNDRKSLVAALLNPFQAKYDRVNTLITIADMVIADCDKAGYGIKAINDALAVATRRENA